MRIKNSITDQVFNAINAFGAGNTFTVDDIYNNNMRCGSMYGQRQRLYDILCMLNKTGLISRVKRGTYKVEFPLPANLTYTDVESYCGYRSKYDGKNGVRKQNPFDINSYKASFSSTAEEIPMPHSSGNVVETGANTKTIYSVNPKSGEITPKTVMSFDKSYLALPFMFDDIDSAEAFAEGIVVVGESDDELDNALENIENEIAETLVQQGDPASNPENQRSTETRTSEVENETKVLGQFVPLILAIGTVIYMVEKDGDNASVIKDEVDEIEIEITKAGVEYEFETTKGYEFSKDDLGVTAFTSKDDAAAALFELL